MIERHSAQDIPAWYKLNSQNGEITIDIHQKARKQAENFNPKDVDYLQKILELPNNFLPASKNNEWGFGRVLKTTDSTLKDWIRYHCFLPIAKADGTVDWDALYSVSATLSILTANLNKDVPETDSKTPQMLTVNMQLRGRSQNYGAMIYADILPATCKWINKNLESEQGKAISNEMHKSHVRMTGREKTHYEHYFRTSLREPKWIHLDCPGNACGLDPEHSARENPEIGYSLIPHNTDHALQQLTLLSGLAKLDNLAAVDYL